MTHEIASPQATRLLCRLEQELQQTYADWQVGELSIIGAGLDALVCRADSIRFGPVALRVPWTRWISNDNDADLDARLLLEQEATLATHMRTHGVAAPQVFALHLGADSFDFLVSEFVENDRSLPEGQSIGTLLRAIHDSPVIDHRLAVQGDVPIEDLVAERLIQRAAVVEHLTNVRLPMPNLCDVRATLAWPAARRCILHMDVRPENMLTCAGKVRAIIDWSNALLGDPVLELARIAEYGYLSDAFLAGYGLADCFAHLPAGVELLYRLDTAIMLAVVFLSEAPDPDRAVTQVQRVVDLCDALNQRRARPRTEMLPRSD